MRTVALIDGEHYPPVTIRAIEVVRSRGHEVVAAVFLGGFEKLDAPLQLDIPIIASVEEAIDQYDPELIFDCSDDPVVDFDRRFQLVALATSRGVAYEAPGFRMTPGRATPISVPTIAVIGSGKRCGKTAISAHVARTLREHGMNVVIVAMGRGGPANPRLVRGDIDPPSATSLLSIADLGEHAASDVYEDAVVARVAVVGARRAGAGPTGSALFDTVEEAAALALSLAPDLVILEGSGTAIPPVSADATILVARDSDDWNRWPVAQRILLADLLVVRMLEEQVDSTRTTFPNRDPVLPVINVSLRPTPMVTVEGRRVFVATTAPVQAENATRTYLEQHYGASVVGFSCNLSVRERLREELIAARDTYDLLLCELKAAAIDVAVREAVATGKEVVFLDNRPEGNELENEIRTIADLAKSRFERRKKS